jgi:hypothetical protein
MHLFFRSTVREFRLSTEGKYETSQILCSPFLKPSKMMKIDRINRAKWSEPRDSHNRRIKAKRSALQTRSEPKWAPRPHRRIAAERSEHRCPDRESKRTKRNELYCLAEELKRSELRRQRVRCNRRSLTYKIDRSPFFRHQFEKRNPRNSLCQTAPNFQAPSDVLEP